MQWVATDGSEQRTVTIFEVSAVWSHQGENAVLLQGNLQDQSMKMTYNGKQHHEFLERLHCVGYISNG
jgi:hypothetical protein